jgi:hypothetical protein
MPQRCTTPDTPRFSPSTLTAISLPPWTWSLVIRTWVTEGSPICFPSRVQIAHHYDIEAIGKAHKPDGWYMGGNPTERAYRRWCLDHVLFLNPLNDIEAAPVAARDIMGLPNFTTAIDEPPIVIGMFNELKQGFASARWMLWEGITSEGRISPTVRCCSAARSTTRRTGFRSRR